MNPIDSICKFIENTKGKSESKPSDKYSYRRNDTEKEEEEKSSFDLKPRDGMSLESVKFAIRPMHRQQPI